MNDPRIIDLYEDYQSLVDHMLEDFTFSYSEDEIETLVLIISKLSFKAKRIINRPGKKGIPIQINDIVQYLKSDSYFRNRNSDYKAGSGIIMLQYWHEKFNSRYQIMNDDQMKSAAISIMEQIL
jgi:hypothetical protein